VLVAEGRDREPVKDVVLGIEPALSRRAAAARTVWTARPRFVQPWREAGRGPGREHGGAGLPRRPTCGRRLAKSTR